MQALRRVASVALREGTRGFGYTSQANQLVGKTHGSNTADKIGLFIMLPMSVGFISYDLMYPEEEFEGKIPHYPYLHIRTRDRYPWGNDRGPFEHHRECAGARAHAPLLRALRRAEQGSCGRKAGLWTRRACCGSTWLGARSGVPMRAQPTRCTAAAFLGGQAAPCARRRPWS